MSAATDHSLAGLRKFCETRGIAPAGVMAVTVQRNFKTDFLSLIVDWDNAALLPSLTAETDADYKEARIGEFMVTFAVGLARPPPASSSGGFVPEGDEPFCCGCIAPYKPCRVSHESAFSDFLARRGHHPDVVYEVKTQVNNGPLLNTKYFQLVDSIVSEVKGPFRQKMHSFKNYKCTAHDLFYAVDLYQMDDSHSGANAHHMRLVPFTKINTEVLDAFFLAL